MSDSIGKSILLFAVLVCGTCLGQEPTDAEKREALVYDSLSDLIDIRDRVVRQYAMFVEAIESDNASMERMPSRFFIVRRHNDFEYRAINLVSSDPVLHEHSLGAYVVASQTWHEWFRDGTRWAMRTTESNDFNLTRTNPPYVERPKGRRPMDWLREIALPTPMVDPFDSYLWPNDPFMPNISPGLTKRTIETFIAQTELVKTEPGLRGQIHTTWQFRNGTPWVTEIVFDPGFGGMPIKIGAQNKKSGEWVHLLIQWKKPPKAKSLWLPRRIEYEVLAKGEDGDIQHKNVFLHQWSMGKEVPDKTFDSSAADMRAAVMEHFERPYDRVVDGKLVYGRWTVPQELITADAD